MAKPITEQELEKLNETYMEVLQALAMKEETIQRMVTTESVEKKKEMLKMNQGIIRSFTAEDLQMLESVSFSFFFFFVIVRDDDNITSIDFKVRCIVCEANCLRRQYNFRDTN